MLISREELSHETGKKVFADYLGEGVNMAVEGYNIVAELGIEISQLVKYF